MGLKLTFQSFARKALSVVFSLLPVEDDLVLLEGGMAYDDNTRALFEHMYYELGMGRDYKFVWFVDKPDDFVFLNELDNVQVRRHLAAKPLETFVSREWVRSIALNCRARYCIYCNAFVGMRRFPGQTRFYLTHGTPLKNVVGALGDSRVHDYAFATSEYAAGWVRHCIPGMEGKVLVTGFPRNDVMLKGSDGTLCEQFAEGSSSMKKILWMPTFKHQKNQDRNDLAVDRNNDLGLLTAEFMESLNEKLVERDASLFIKFHPQQDLGFVDFYSLSNIVCLTRDDLDRKGVELYSLISEFDALVTDYSSISFDYLLLNRPIAYDLTDFEAYRNGIGFVVNNPLDYMPGHKILGKDDFFAFVDQVSTGSDDWSSKREDVCALMHKYRDDKSCERVLSELGMNWLPIHND